MAARVQPCRGRVWPCRGRAPRPCCSPSCSVAAPMPLVVSCRVARLRVSLPRAPAHPTPPAPRACVPCAPCAPRKPACAVSWPGWPCRNTVQQPTAPTVTIQNIVLQYKIFQPSLLLPTIQKLYCNTIFNTHSTCNTLHIAIQNLPNLQYNPFLAIQLGSSLIQISAPVFFFHYKYFFPIISIS